MNDWMRRLQRVEQGGDHEGRGDDGELRLLLLAGEGAEDGLRPPHAAEVEAATSIAVSEP